MASEIDKNQPCPLVTLAPLENNLIVSLTVFPGLDSEPLTTSGTGTTTSGTTATATSAADKASAAARAANLAYWKERTEFIFIICMAVLLIYYFKPGTTRQLNSETSLLFFLFGWILIITAKWNVFFTQAKWYSSISGP